MFPRRERDRFEGLELKWYAETLIHGLDEIIKSKEPKELILEDMRDFSEILDILSSSEKDRLSKIRPGSIFNRYHNYVKMRSFVGKIGEDKMSKLREFYPEVIDENLVNEKRKISAQRVYPLIIQFVDYVNEQPY